jgi:S-adenosylmethionine decarboxylase
MMTYKPGLHLIATLTAQHPANLLQALPCQQVIDAQIQALSLQKLGEVYHNFTPAGFTAVVCLSESHISIHTWPEFNKINLDIYLSNHERSNEGAVEAIYVALIAFFGATVEQEQRIVR